MISLTREILFFKDKQQRDFSALSLELVKMKMFYSAKYILERMKDKSQIERKYLQNAYQLNDFYPT